MSFSITKQQVLTIIATGFAIGRVPKAPGTFGSALTFLLLYLLACATRLPVIELLQKTGYMFCAVIGLYALGCWATDAYMRATGKHDPKEVVIDEIAGQWLTLTLAVYILPDWVYMQHLGIFFILCFLFFRLFDVVKLGPVKWADSKLDGAHGVMLDDIFAGVFAGIVTSVAMYMVVYVF